MTTREIAGRRITHPLTKLRQRRTSGGSGRERQQRWNADSANKRHLKAIRALADIRRVLPKSITLLVCKCEEEEELAGADQALEELVAEEPVCKERACDEPANEEHAGEAQAAAAQEAKERLPIEPAADSSIESVEETAAAVDQDKLSSTECPEHNGYSDLFEDHSEC